MEIISKVEVKVETVEQFTWLVSPTVDVLYLVQVTHDCFPPVVDVIKRCRLHWQLPSDVFAEKYVLHTT